MWGLPAFLSLAGPTFQKRCNLKRLLLLGLLILNASFLLMGLTHYF